MGTTPEQYVQKYKQYFLAITDVDFTSIGPQELIDRYDRLMKAIDNIRLDITIELEQRWNAGGRIVGRGFSIMVIESNQTWNRVNDLLTELTGYSWLPSDLFLNLYLAMLESE